MQKFSRLSESLHCFFRLYSLAITSTGRVGICILCFYMSRNTRKLNRQYYGFKAPQKTKSRLKVSSDRPVEAENRTRNPWCTRYKLIIMHNHLENICISSVQNYHQISATTTDALLHFNEPNKRVEYTLTRTSFA